MRNITVNIHVMACITGLKSETAVVNVASTMLHQSLMVSQSSALIQIMYPMKCLMLKILLLLFVFRQWLVFLIHRAGKHLCLLQKEGSLRGFCKEIRSTR